MFAKKGHWPEVLSWINTVVLIGAVSLLILRYARDRGAPCECVTSSTQSTLFLEDGDYDDLLNLCLASSAPFESKFMAITVLKDYRKQYSYKTLKRHWRYLQPIVAARLGNLEGSPKNVAICAFLMIDLGDGRHVDRMKDALQRLSYEGLASDEYHKCAKNYVSAYIAKYEIK